MYWKKLLHGIEFSVAPTVIWILQTYNNQTLSIMSWDDMIAFGLKECGWTMTVGFLPAAANTSSLSYASRESNSSCINNSHGGMVTKFVRFWSWSKFQWWPITIIDKRYLSNWTVFQNEAEPVEHMHNLRLRITRQLEASPAMLRVVYR